MPIRVHMYFGETSILVPCGDGKLSVGDLVKKAIQKFKKLVAKHPDDVVEVRGIRLMESRSLLDEDDEVIDVLEDKDTVVLDYGYYPHRDSGSLQDVSDDSAIVGSSSQPYSPGNLDNNGFDSAHPDKSFEEGNELEQSAVGGGVQVIPHSQELHTSQDHDLLNPPTWTPLTNNSQSQESPAAKPAAHDDPSDSDYETGNNPTSQISYGYTSDQSQGHNEPVSHTTVTTGTRLSSGGGSHSNLSSKRRSRGHSKENLKGSPQGSRTSLLGGEGRSSERRGRSETLPIRWNDPLHLQPGRPPLMTGRGGMYWGAPYHYGPHPPYDPYYPGPYHEEPYRPPYLRAPRNFQGSRTLSTERIDQMGGFGPGNRMYNYPPYRGFDEEFLSQPSLPPGSLPSYGGYDHGRMGNHPSPGVFLSQQPVPTSWRGFDPPLDRPPPRGGGLGGRGYSIENDLDEEPELTPGKGDAGPSPFTRAGRKSMFRDGPAYSDWMEYINEHGIEDGAGNSEVPEYLASLSQRSRTPSPVPDHTHQEDEESDTDEDPQWGNIHIVELHKGDEPLGIYLTHYTSPDGRDLGVFIGDMDPTSFAAQSGKLRIQDRILACNGVDFTKELTNAHVEEIFTQMSREPLLRMAISRGEQKSILSSEQGAESGGVVKQEPKASEAVNGPKIVSNPSQPPSVTLTNTRQIGVKHTITLNKPTSTSPLGFGVTSRDVMTDNQNVPFYIKNITSGGSAFKDGRLKIGDRLLQVNGREVTGLSRPEVVSLLKEQVTEVTIVISRQEIVDVEEADESLRPATSVPQTTVGKTVLTLNISLSNTGSAGLGVTVYGRTTLGSGKKAGDMGIYIKSIVPGGAAALDGRLRKNDQLLCVNKEALLGCSNQEALDKLRTALSKASSGGSVELVVARRVHNPSSSLSPSMAALGEEPEEEEKADDEKGREVGIDCPIDAHPSKPSSHLTPQTSIDSRHHLTPQSSAEGRHSADRIDRLINQTSITETDSAKSSPRGSRSATFSGNMSSPRTRLRGQKVGVVREAVKDHSVISSQSPLKRAADLMGSGEFDRLEPLPTSSPRSPVGSPYSNRRGSDLEHSTELRPHRPTTPQSPLSMQNQVSSWYDDAVASMGDPRMRTASLDRRSPRDYAVEYRPGQRTYNKSEPGAYHRAHTHDMYPSMSRDGSLRSGRSITSPSDVDIHMSSGQSSREGSVHHSHLSSRFDYYGNQLMYPGNQFYGGDSAPTRGSGRKGRDRPERGSGRYQTSSHYSSSSSSVSPSISLMMPSDVTGGSPLTSGYATIPRSGSRTSERESTLDQSNPETSSLTDLRLSDSETNDAFNRDQPGRISITKKTKRIPKRDFAHMQLSNVEPLVEGEAPVLIRTGSDSCLNESNGATFLQHSLHEMELGPQLGLAKSSSLESLHNVMQHTIKRDVVDDGPGTNRAGAQLYDREATPTAGSEQRGVDVSYDLDSSSVPAVMSYTKNPTSRKAKKPGFFKKVFKKKSKSGKKERPASISTPISTPMGSHKRGGSVDLILEQDNFSEAERELLKTGFSIPVRLGDESLGDIRVPGDSRYGNTSEPQRHSMPIIDDYDSPGSPTDDAVLSTMAKV